MPMPTDATNTIAARVTAATIWGFAIADGSRRVTTFNR
jgi:hypothetical protein